MRLIGARALTVLAILLALIGITVAVAGIEVVRTIVNREAPHPD